jgi:hypothetical protein
MVTLWHCTNPFHAEILKSEEHSSRRGKAVGAPADRQLRNEKARLIESHFRGPDFEDENFFFVFDVPYYIPGVPA